MDNGIHFITGLPRSGSTLLAALLRQYPRFHAGMTSPVGNLFAAMQRAMSQENETAVFIDDDQRARLLTACFDAYYADIHPARLIFDTNRQWTAKLSAVARLFPAARLICCVRSPAWALDSIERLVRRNPLEPSGIFKFDPGGTVYSRAEGLMSATGMIGFALSALREAVFHDERAHLLLVRFDTLTADPHGTLAAIYDFIGEPSFRHDPGHVETNYEEVMFDARLGTPGLHSLGSVVRPQRRNTALPPDLFTRHDADAFWNLPDCLPDGVRCV